MNAKVDALLAKQDTLKGKELLDLTFREMCWLFIRMNNKNIARFARCKRLTTKVGSMLRQMEKNPEMARYRAEQNAAYNKEMGY